MTEFPPSEIGNGMPEAVHLHTTANEIGGGALSAISGTPRERRGSPLTLPGVTLVLVDCVAPALSRLAIEDTLCQIRPAAALFVGSPRLANADVGGVPMRWLPDRLDSLDRAMNALWYRVPPEVETSHLLVIQWDGWVLDGSLWEPEWLDADYIGAPWWWHPDKRVGNGGFSLRSTRLMRFLAAHSDKFPVAAIEDDALCRQYRPALEAEGFRWAPEEIAMRFSFEYTKPASHGTFGFHDMRNWPWVLDDAALDRRLAIADDYVRGKGLIPRMLAKRAQIRGQQSDIFPKSADQLMSEALRLHGQGKPDQAEPLYREILALTPRHAEALHLLGVCALQRRRLEDAHRLIAEALAIAPDHADALSNHAATLRALGRLDEALASYNKALTVRPAFAEVLHNRGNVLKDLGRLEEAVASYDEALAVKPDLAQAHFNRGNVLLMLDRLEEALASFDATLAVRPDYAEALNTRAAALLQLGRPQEALASCESALSLKSEFPEALSNRGVALGHLGRLEEALASFDRALQLKPDYVAALTNRGKALFDLHSVERAEEALAACDKALAVNPGDAGALANRAHLLFQLERPQEALASSERALTVRPDSAEALNTRAAALYGLGRANEALASHAAAIAISPDFAEAHWNEALCRLALGDFATGWQKYEWRWRTKFGARDKRDLAGPLWLGKEDLCGKTVFLHAEQGYGDTLQFCRYAPAVAARGATVILAVPAPLKSLLRTLPGVEQVVSEYDRSRPIDFHCPLMSLPLAFGTEVETIPAPVPYLWPNPYRTATWRERLTQYGGLKIGLVWAGSRKLGGRPVDLRAMRLDQLRQIGGVPGVTLVSLQKGEPASQIRTAGFVIHDWTDELADFADTAALVAALDLVITVDTSVAHLAGALGKPVWVLLHHIPDWRWRLHRDHTAWYPTMRLFAQFDLGDWPGVVRRTCAELHKLANARPISPTAAPPRLAPTNRSNTAPELMAELAA